MGISLAEYRELIGGKATLAEIEARHGCASNVVQPKQVSQIVQPAKPCKLPRGPGKSSAIVAQVKAAADAAKRQAAKLDKPTQLDGGWLGDLPYPPSLNRYYRHVGEKVLISKHGRRYRKVVERLLDGCQRIGGRVMLRVDVYPPDLRRRDLDNLLKGLQDSLMHGGLLADDSDIKVLHMEMHDPKRPFGMVRVGLSRISGKV